MRDEIHVLWVLRELFGLSVCRGGTIFVQLCGLSCDVCLKGKGSSTGMWLEEVSENSGGSAMQLCLGLPLDAQGNVAQKLVFCPLFLS